MQVSKQKGLGIEAPDCGPGAAADTICTTYSQAVRQRGSEMDAGVCGGDSGAPLYRASPVADQHVLIGITSYFFPPNRGCSSTRDSHFISVARHAAWIQSVVSSHSADAGLVACGEVILEGPIEVRFSSGPGSLTLTTFAEISGQRSRPNVRLSGIETNSCQSIPAFGVTSCRISSASEVRLELEVGFAQATLCRS